MSHPERQNFINRANAVIAGAEATKLKDYIAAVKESVQGLVTLSQRDMRRATELLLQEQETLAKLPKK
jgi:hypothetical protein